MGAIGSFIDPPKIDVGTDLARNAFNATAAGTGTGPDQLNERNYNDLITNALAQQSGAFGNQNALVGSLQAQAAGTGGPNLAQQQLQNATNQNIQSQAGAVASLRGLNPAAAQRLIAMNAAGIQQGAVGQSAELRMQQQLAAQQQLGNVLAQQAGEGQNQFVTSAGALGNQNALNLQNQQGAQGLNAQAAGQNAGLKSQAQANNMGLVQQGAQTVGALTNTAGTLGASALGGGAAAGGAAAGGAAGAGDVALLAGLAAHGTLVPPGGKRPYLLSPGERVITADGDETVVPGKRKVAADDERNDTKPALLPAGAVVAPASISDDPEAVEAFVAAVKKHRKMAYGGAVR